MPSVIIYEGSIYYDPNADKEFEVLEAPEPGSPEHANVLVEYEDGETIAHPYDHFGGYHDAYELVEKGDEYPTGESGHAVA
jgi:hypothetical protein